MADPQRQCVGCRERKPQAQMARFVRTADGWEQDTRKKRKLDGRGVYLCSFTCAQKAIKNRRYPELGAVASQRFL